MFDLAVKSNYTLTAGKLINAVVLIKNGVIVEISDTLPADANCEVVDVGNKVLLPGMIDPHVHINEPGRTEWEGFQSATRAAIAGGLTTLVDMPLNSSPVTTSVPAFREKLLAASGHLSANCGFWGGIVPGNQTEIEGLIEEGVLGFKAFLTHSGIDEFPNVNEKDLRTAMPLIAKYDLPLLAHCELITGDQQQATGDPRVYQNYLASRPRRWEDEAIALMIRLCEDYHCRVHIVHLSSSGSIGQIQKAKQKGLPLTVETAQHYLYFNAEDIPDGKTQFKCAPPIRERANNDLLWEALQNGIIDFVATDHSPSLPVLKEIQSGDFMKAWGGVASLQFALPALWTAAKKRDASINDVARWLSEKPANLMGLQHCKGRIAPGYDADLVVFDAEKKFLVTEEIIHHKHTLTPYLNEELDGVVEQTYLGGIKVFDSGRFLYEDKGKIITRKMQ